MKWWMSVIVFGLVMLGIILGGKSWFVRQVFAPTESNLEQGLNEVDTALRQAQGKPSIEVVAEDLEIPWAVDWLPGGTMLVTERPGRLLAFDAEGNRSEISLPDTVAHTGEAGLLGLAVHPKFASNNFIYLYRTQEVGSSLINRVERWKLIGGKLSGLRIIIENIPGARFHDGGRMAFGPDGRLYITAGDAGDSARAQDKESLAGKILKVNDDGSVPNDNPFASPVYSWGHRNPQGIIWDSSGSLWATEHGRSGALSGLDELNLIVAGKNYGWPVFEGDETQGEMVAPVIHSGADDTWAPASAAYLDGSVFFGGLRGEALYEAKINGPEVIELKQHWREQFGRIREVAVGPDGWLYLTTSNTDGRGKVRGGDDKIIRVNPILFD